MADAQDKNRLEGRTRTIAKDAARDKGKKDEPTTDRAANDDFVVDSPPATNLFALDDTAVKRVSNSGDRIGPYRLVKCLGKGGMGSVWIAEQSEPVKRQVALKLIRAGIDSHGILGRFETERRALALMDHPNIARILDAGTAPGGQPWFAMELVRGTALTKFCDDNQLTIADRLRLFCEICAGVQHAHQKGIIHRDLKPGNIVVATIDGKPVPKVIDFGLAKAIESSSRLVQNTAHTSIGQILGTLKYMSPEQASLDGVDIDTRTDIYSLGVILYELLLGTTPLNDDSIRDQPLLEVLERIRERETIKPSKLLNTIESDRLSDVLADRKSDRMQLSRVLAGDLDWIAIKALEKDRSRRYQSASELQSDVLRFLDNEPVEARPPSRRYRLQKFVRKNRMLVTSAGLIAATLIAGIVGTSWAMVVANRRAIGEGLAKKESDDRLQQIEKGNSILSGIFQDLDIEELQAGTESLESVLAERLIEAGRELDAGTIGDPSLLADMKNQLAESLLGLGFFPEAIGLFEEVKQIRDEMLGPNHPDTLDTLNAMAKSWQRAEMLDKALPMFESILEQRRSQLGPEDPATLTSMNNLAEANRLQQNLNDAIPMFRQTLERRQKVLGSSHRDTLLSMSNLALALVDNGQLDEGIKLYQDGLALATENLPPTHPTTLGMMNNLAAAWRNGNHLDKSLELYEQAFEILTVNRGPSHPDTMRTANNLAEVYRAAGKLVQSENLFEQTLARLKVKMGLDSPETLGCLSNLAQTLFAKRELDRAIGLFRESIDGWARSGLADSPESLSSLQGLAACYWRNGSPELAVPIFEQGLRIQRDKLGNEHYETLSTMANLGVVYRDMGRVDESIELLELAVAKAGTYPSLQRARAELRTAYLKIGRLEEVATMLDQDLEAIRKETEPGSLPRAASLAAIGLHLLGIKKFDEAETVLRESCLIREEYLPDDWRTFNTFSMLGQALTGQGQLARDSNDRAQQELAAELYNEAEQLLNDSLEDLERVQDTIPPISRAERMGEAFDRLIDYYLAIGDKEKEAKWRERKSAFHPDTDVPASAIKNPEPKS